MERHSILRICFHDGTWRDVWQESHIRAAPTFHEEDGTLINLEGVSYDAFSLDGTEYVSRSREAKTVRQAEYELRVEEHKRKKVEKEQEENLKRLQQKVESLELEKELRTQIAAFSDKIEKLKGK